MKTGRQFVAVADGMAIALTMSALGAEAQTIKTPSRFVPGDATAAAAAKDQNSPFLCQGVVYYEAALEALRVAPDGHVLDPKPIKLFNVGATWAVATDGSGWLVVNQGTSVNGDLVAARISSAGVLLDPGPRSLLKATY